MDSHWECVVVGGGSAGLSAALVLGRARRRTLLIDAGEQSNLAATGVGGLHGHDGRPPADLYAAGRAEIAAYSSVEIRTGVAVRDGRRLAEGFELDLPDGSRVGARKLLLATGMEYRPPDLPGLAERWGGAVFHCPFCHGWEVRDRALGVLGGGPGAVQKAILLRAWSDEVTLLTDGDEELGAEDKARLEAVGVAVEERPLARLLGAGRDLEEVEFRDGSRTELGGLLVGISLHQRSDLASRLGITLVPGSFGEEAIEVDGRSETGVAGLYAAGDVCVRMPSVANAVASGSTAAAMMVQALTAEAAGGESANRIHSH
jgi:thioredoxin reductase